MTHIQPRPLAAVIGPGTCLPEEAALAEQVGRALVDEGFRVVTGGLGGVMEAASRGAHLSSRHQPGDVIGVLPTYDHADANPWVEVAICTGLQHARNVIVAATGQVILAIGGRAGTLSEIALGWRLNRPVICVGTAQGWATELAGRALDDRFREAVHGPLAPVEAALLARRLLSTNTP